MYQTIFFDLDGTLVNSLEDLADSANHALKDLGYPEHDVNEYRYFVGSGVDKLFERALPSEHNDAQTVKKARAVFETYYNRSYCNKTVPYVSVKELLKALEEQHYKIAVLSNKPDTFARHILDTLFPDFQFDYVLGASDDLPKKPAPDGLLNCLEELRVQPENCIYCGDSDVDILFAHHANVQAVGAAWGFRGIDELDEAGADYVINYPTDLLTILDILN